MLVTAEHRDVGETISMLLTLRFNHLRRRHLLSFCTGVQTISQKFHQSRILNSESL